MEQERINISSDADLFKKVLIGMEADELIGLMEQAYIEGLSLCDYCCDVLAEAARGHGPENI